MFYTSSNMIDSDSNEVEGRRKCDRRTRANGERTAIFHGGRSCSTSLTAESISRKQIVCPHCQKTLWMRGIDVNTQRCLGGHLWACPKYKKLDNSCSSKNEGIFSALIQGGLLDYQGTESLESDGSYYYIVLLNL